MENEIGESPECTDTGESLLESSDAGQGTSVVPADVVNDFGRTDFNGFWSVRHVQRRRSSY